MLSFALIKIDGLARFIVFINEQANNLITIKKKKGEKCMSDNFDISRMISMRNHRDSYTHEGESREGIGKGQGDTEHTAHSDTMLLRKRKRGRVGGSAR